VTQAGIPNSAALTIASGDGRASQFKRGTDARARGRISVIRNQDERHPLLQLVGRVGADARVRAFGFESHGVYLALYRLMIDVEMLGYLYAPWAGLPER
jgi:hypothetical protein